MLAALAVPVALGVGVPLATIVYWMAQSQQTTLPAVATLSQATWNTFIYSALGALGAVALAVPVAMMSFRRSSPIRVMIERATFITLALPGVVVALSLVYFATRYADGIYQTSGLLIAAYVIMHFPLALVCVKTSVVQTSARLVDVGHSLGRGRLSVFLRVTLPLLAPGMLAGFCLVFLMAATELTATLVLAPIGVMTLATQFWAFQSEVAYGAAAPYALVMMALAVVPAAVLALWFDRGAQRCRRSRRERNPAARRLQALRLGAGADRSRADGRGRVDHRRARLLWERQDDDAQADRRFRPARCGNDRDRRACRRRRSGERPTAASRRRLRASGRRPVPTPDRDRQRRLRPAPGRSGTSAGTARAGRPRRARAALSPPALRR